MRIRVLFCRDKACFVSTLVFFATLFFSQSSFSQTDCGNNAGFETGTTAGWVCKYGYYGRGPCFTPLDSGLCHSFLTIDSIIGCLNANGINASLTDSSNRHTIMNKNAYGTGIDPNSTSPAIPVVDSGGGNYSLRLGDGLIGGYLLNG